jgi:BUD22
LRIYVSPLINFRFRQGFLYPATRSPHRLTDMPKRKLSDFLDHDFGDQDKSFGPAFTKQRILCGERIEHGKKLLRRALKLAAGFERQKYSRRRKTARQNNDTTTLARLDTEYQVLKVRSSQDTSPEAPLANIYPFDRTLTSQLSPRIIFARLYSKSKPLLPQRLSRPLL